MKFLDMNWLEAASPGEEYICTMSATTKPPRTLGLSLAIVLSVLLYTVLPFALLAIDLSIKNRFEQLNELAIPYPDGSEGEALAVGGTANIVSSERLIFDVVVGAIFLTIAIFAWIGRPHWIRLLMLLAVLAMAALNLALIARGLMTPVTIEAGMSSGDSLARTLNIGLLVVHVLVPLYVGWYVNRGPARAFYRGAYLPAREAEAGA
jgi:hypothetical protein